MLGIDIKKYEFLLNKLASVPQENYPASSRIHALQTFGPQYYVKREDELGFGISGSKFRKYRALIPHLKTFKEIIVLGGPYSNNVLGISQLLIENRLKLTLFLKGNKPAKSKGNFLFLQTLVSEKSMRFISHDNWRHIDEMIADYTFDRKDICILSEGSALFPSFLGSLTLPLDIICNEKQLGLAFDHIYCDVGTGYTAAALLLAFAFLEKKCHFHFLCVAGSREEFENKVRTLHQDFQSWLGINFSLSQNFDCEMPHSAKSFGSTNAMLFQEIQNIARYEGFFVDPIYSGKLFYHVKHKKGNTQHIGNVLMIHSGGALSFSGFQDDIEKNWR